MTSSVRMSGCSWSRGATRMPATEASEAPMDQLRVESCQARPPKSPTSGRLSTTPRMAMPVRVR